MNEEEKAKIKQHYQKGEGSIQDLARVYRCTVEEVLAVLELSEINSVEGIGDLIDQDEAGEDTPLIPFKKYKQKYTLN